jgi:S-formylglutathione hydrolase FrmB
LVCFAIDVKNIRPGVDVVFNDKAVSFPVPLTDLERGIYYAEAVWDRNTGGRSIARSPDNMYSRSLKVKFDKQFQKTFKIVCEQVNQSTEFPESKFAKELKVESPSLSHFYSRQSFISGAVVLPASYNDSLNKKYPVLFEISGYGGDYKRDHLSLIEKDSSSMRMDSVECIYVFLDGNCPTGHSEYANSLGSGPWGDALTKEFIPALEKKFRCNGARLLWGHSSGGWSVLWLKIQYPELFTAAWSSSPDPVDFRNFSDVNLYEDQNYLLAKDSSFKNDATVDGYFPWVYARDYRGMERVIYRGEQMRSFDAVFSPLLRNGEPAPVCDYLTGKIDTSVVNEWKKFDISLILRNNWESYKQKIDGKIRVTVGKQDNFYLNRSVRLLEKEMKTLKADMEFEYYLGDHFIVGTKEYFQKGFAFLRRKYEEWRQRP